MAKQNRMAVAEEPSQTHVLVDGYRSAPHYGHVPPAYEQIGQYVAPIKLRTPVNSLGLALDGPGMREASQMGRTWDAGDTLHNARSQGASNPLTGGATKQPLPSYSASIMMTDPPPQNRAAFSAAVTRFLATRGNRANGGG